MKLHLFAFVIAALALCFSASAETVDVKYRGPVNISSFDCPTIKGSSFVNRICYHQATSYLIVKLRSTYYHYCDVGLDLFGAFVDAPSLGRFYNQAIKGQSYNCQGKAVPTF